ncbi:MAG TPA: DnaJ domain-containing protein, partial [Terriglobales bacterium]|nr:DnaJ domain-containing protein [Terriglobales bacterium]
MLGLSATASPDEVKQAYRDLVKVWHPDRFPGDPRLRDIAQEKLKAINEAYGRLARVTRPVASGRAASPPPAAEPPAPPPPPPPPPPASSWKMHLGRGVAAYRARRYDEAEAAFR